MKKKLYFLFTLLILPTFWAGSVLASDNDDNDDDTIIVIPLLPQSLKNDYKSVLIEINKNATLQELKKKCNENFGKSIINIGIFFRGKLLKGNKKLSEYKIYNKETVHIIDQAQKIKKSKNNNAINQQSDASKGEKLQDELLSQDQIWYILSNKNNINDNNKMINTEWSVRTIIILFGLSIMTLIILAYFKVKKENTKKQKRKMKIKKSLMLR